MGKKFKNLIQRIASRENLLNAFEKASKGKRRSMGYLVFKEHLGANLARLHDELSDGTYKQGAYRNFFVFEPKKREISALPFYDRVAQHALCNVIDPILDATFLPQSYACRTNKGTHAGAIDLQAMMRRMGKDGNVYALKTDFSKFFPSVDRAILRQEIMRKISCEPTMKLIDSITPLSGKGLPIGNLTSQLYANVYGNIIDQWLVHHMGESRFIRYMDDIVVLAHTKEYLQCLRMALGWKSKSINMGFSHWSIQSVERGVNFLGYRIFPTHKLLRRQSVISARRKILRYTANGNTDALQRFVASWRGHARWANSHNLLTKLGVAQ